MGKLVRIIDKEKGKEYTKLTDLALDLYKEGWNTLWMKIDTLAQAFDTGEWYLLDRCGNCEWLNPKRFVVEVSEDE